MTSPHNHYFKDVRHLDTVDVYRVLELFNVTDPCIQHGLKKLLVAGGRGAGKDIERDVRECIDSLNRYLQMQAENDNKPLPKISEVISDVPVKEETPQGVKVVYGSPMNPDEQVHPFGDFASLNDSDMIPLCGIALSYWPSVLHWAALNLDSIAAIVFNNENDFINYCVRIGAQYDKLELRPLVTQGCTQAEWDIFVRCVITMYNEKSGMDGGPDPRKALSNISYFCQLKFRGVTPLPPAPVLDGRN